MQSEENKNTPPPFKIPITVFLAMISTIILIAALGVGHNILQKMDYVAKISRSVQEESLPKMSESQRSFINLESLRRSAEVAYVSETAQTRREARLNAASLAAESVFENDRSFHQKALDISDEIGSIARAKDQVNEAELKLKELASSYDLLLKNIIFPMPPSKKLSEFINNFIETSLNFHVDLSTRAPSQNMLQKIKEQDTSKLEALEEMCKDLTAGNAQASAHCVSMQKLRKEYISLQANILKYSTIAQDTWKHVDEDLREMRDNVSTVSEISTASSLKSIESAATQAKGTYSLLFGITVIFILLCIFVIHYHIIRPIIWAGQTLRALQQGTLKVKIPNIRIKELSEVAALISHFSSHIAELYSHTSQLEEDSANKRDLEEVMRAVFLASLDGYIICSEHEITLASSGIIELLGASNEREITNSWQKFGFSDASGRLELFTRAQLKGPFRNELTLCSVSEEPIPSEITYLPITFRGQKMLLLYIRDLRLQKNTEEALRLAKMQAEEAAKTKSEFLARMSHEIRTPMNGVLGLTHLALEKDPPPEQRNYLQKIQSSARILLGVINDVLDFSKIEESKLKLEIAPFSLNEIIRTVMDLFLPQASDKKIKFILQKDKNIPDALEGDSLRLSQVLLNLCGNAIKFTQQGKVTLSIKLLNSNDKQATIMFSVVDTGVGLTPEQQSLLFKPFSQVHEYTTRKYGGTGLGLMISKRLVELMGGNINIESIESVGSNFSFAVSFGLAPDEYTEKTKALGNPAPLKGYKFLLVEDNDINQEIAKALVESMGGEVLVAENGQECLDILQNETVDLVYMDIQMPVMDGFTATKLIRASERAEIANLPIIAMTAHATKEDKDKSLNAGMTEHITKPIDVNELREKTIHCLAAASA